MEEIYDTVIIGSGPAGLAAAIYNVRAALKTVVVSGDQPGGQLTITTLVENYPGFPNGIGGVKLMMDMQQQVKNLGGEIRNGLVTAISNFQFPISKQIPNSNYQIKNGFVIKLENGESLTAKAVIVATGAAAKWLGLPREKELIGRGISGCATCDGSFFRDRVVAVVGGSDVACEDAYFLTKFAKKVYIIHRRDQLRAQVPQQKLVMNNPKIEFLWNCEVKEIQGEEKLTAIKIANNMTGEEKMMELDGLFIAIGRIPATGFLKGLVELKETGQVIVGKDPKYLSMSSIPGIFAAGDCVDEIYRQAIIAAGNGARAGLEAENWLKERRIE